MHPDNERPAAEEAATWLARNDRGLSGVEKEAFEHWRNADPQNAAEFKRLAAAWQNFDLAKAIPELFQSAQSLDQSTYARANRRNNPSWKWAFSALVAALAVAVGVQLWRSGAHITAGDKADQSSYQIIPNAATRLVLEDGSIAELHGNSEIRSEFTNTERRIALLRGEAYFTVVKNRARPFIVGAGQIKVRAVGTAFCVRLEKEEVEIVVTEGKVSVDESSKKNSSVITRDNPAISVPIIVAGQRAVVVQSSTASTTVPSMKVDSLNPLEIDAALSWQTTWVVFNRTPLPEALEAFNRNGSEKLVLEDGSASHRLLDGKFRVDHVEAFVRLLEQTMHLRAQPANGHKIVLIPAP